MSVGFASVARRSPLSSSRAGAGARRRSTRQGRTWLASQLSGHERRSWGRWTWPDVTDVSNAATNSRVFVTAVLHLMSKRAARRPDVKPANAWTVFYRHAAPKPEHQRGPRPTRPSRPAPLPPAKVGLLLMPLSPRKASLLPAECSATGERLRDIRLHRSGRGPSASAWKGGRLRAWRGRHSMLKRCAALPVSANVPSASASARNSSRSHGAPDRLTASASVHGARRA